MRKCAFPQAALIGVVLLALQACGGSQGRAVDAGAIAEGRAAIQETLASTQATSISAALVDDGKLVWAEAFGTADPATGQPATPDTLYSIASVSKTLAAASGDAAGGPGPGGAGRAGGDLCAGLLHAPGPAFPGHHRANAAEPCVGTARQRPPGIGHHHAVHRIRRPDDGRVPVPAPSSTPPACSTATTTTASRWSRTSSRRWPARTTRASSARTS